VAVGKWFNDEKVVDVATSFLRSTGQNQNQIAIKWPLSQGVNPRFVYGALNKEAKKLAQIFSRFLKRDGETPGIAILMLNLPQLVFGYYAAALVRARVVPVNLLPIAMELRSKRVRDIKLKPEQVKELRVQVVDSAPQILFISDYLWPIFEQLDIKPDFFRAIIVTGPQDVLPFPKNFLASIKLKKEGKWVKVPHKKNVYFLNKLLFWRRLRQWFYKAPDFEKDKPRLDDVFQIQYTGGTTGAPKGAMLTHRNVVSNPWQCREHLGDSVGEDERVLGVLPFSHSYGLTVCVNITLLVLHGTLILVTVFDQRKVVKLLEEEKITIFPGVSPMFRAIANVLVLELKDKLKSSLVKEGKISVNQKGVEEVKTPSGPMLFKDYFQEFLKTYRAPSKRFPDLKFCISGASRLDPGVKDLFERLTGTPIIEGYGLSEASPVISVGLPNAAKPQSIGKVLAGTKVFIVDSESGKELGLNEEGEIVVAGPQVMAGYYKKPEETAQVLKDGKLYTGDIGRIDEEGFLYLTDRKKNMIKRQGENIYELLIEEFFLSKAAVKKCAVIGKPDEREGEVPVVFVVLSDGQSLDDVKRAVGGVISPLWLPEEFIAVSEEQFSEWEDAVGKIKKRAIKDFYKKLKGAG